MQSWSRLANNRLYAYYSRVSKVFNLYRVGKFSLLNSSKMSFASLKLLGPKVSLTPCSCLSSLIRLISHV